MADYLDIAGRVRTTASDGVAMEAQEVKDLNQNKSQQEINADVQTELGDRYTKAETYSKEQLNELITTPDVTHVSVVATDATTAVTDVLPATGEANTIYRVGNWDGTQYDPTMYALFAWNGSAYVCLAVRSFVGEVYDISVNHPDGQGNPTPYADLTAALGTDGANIPSDIRRGGMSIKFIQGNVQSSDNKYVGYMLRKKTWSININDWELITVESRTFTGLFSEDPTSNIYIDDIVNLGIYKREGGNYNPRILTVLEYGGIITQVMESYDVTKNKFRIYKRTKQDNVWSNWINLLDDNLTLPIVHSFGRIEIDDNSITFVGGGAYYQKYNREAINNSSVTFTSNGSYRLYVNNGSLAFVSTETNLDVLDYPIIAFVQYKDGIIRSITWNILGKVVNNATPTTADFVKMPSNLFEKSKTGYYLSNDGTMVKSPMWETYIVKMKSGDILSAHLGSVDTPPLIIAAYSNITCNANYYINGVGNIEGIHDYRYVALQDCYVVICNRPATLAVPTIELYSKFSYEEHKDNFINIHTQEVYNDMLDTTGAWIRGYGKHIKIPVDFCEQYTIEAIGNNINYDFLEDNENYSSADGFRHTLQSGNNIKVLVPYSAKYLYIQVSSYDGSTGFFFNALVTKNDKFILKNKDNIELVNIEYSVFSDMPGNSLPHFKKAISDGFKYLKADMHITSDDKVVLCHDEGFTFDGNGDIIAFDTNNYTAINTLTLAQIKTHKFAQQVDGQNVYPCSLDEFIVLCKKHGIVPFLTVRYSDYASTIQVSRNTLYKYGFESFAIYNLYLSKQELYEVCSYINSIDSIIKKCHTIGSNATEIDKKYLALTFETRCNFMDIWNGQESYIVDDIRNIASQQKTQILSMIGSETEFNNSIINGMDGFQNYTRNTYQQIT